MAITNTDIVLFQSQDNSDNDNGGGQRINQEVVDGAVNNLFPDISRIDTVSGDVALRKVFPVVNTDNRDIYFGAHAMIRKVPTDPNVSALIFYTDSATDVRSEARDDIEAYLTPSFETSFYLFGNNIQGSRAITVLQRLTEQLPTVGDVYLIQEGSDTQYVRVRDISPTEVTLSFNRVDYQRRRVVLTLEQPLGFDFTGSSFNPDGQTPNTANMFTTQISDAARYYGTRTLEEDAPAGALTLQLDSIFEQLVPSSVAQTPIINAQALQQGQLLVDTGGVITDTINVVSPFTLPTPAVPGSFRFINRDGSDDGNGNIVNSGGQIIGSIDYITGTVAHTLSTNPNEAITYTIANVIDSQIQFTDSIVITQENQGVVYIRNVSPVPTGQDIYIDYRSGGRWSRLVGNPDGTIGSDPRIGAGLVSDNGDGTATISVTLGANPDIGSTVIFSWGSDDFANDILTAANDDREIYLTYQLDNELVQTSSVSLGYTATSGATTTIAFDADGNYSNGGLTAILDDISGQINFITNDASTLPRFTTNGETIAVAYNYADLPNPGDTGSIEVVNNPAFIRDNSTGEHTFDLATGVVRKGFRITLQGFPVDEEGYFEDVTFITLVADSNGIFRREGSGQSFGTVSVNGNIQIQFPLITYRRATRRTILGGTYTTYLTGTNPLFNLRIVTQMEYQTTGIPGQQYVNVYSESLPVTQNFSYFVRTLPSIIGSVTFVLNNRNFVTRQGNVFDDNGQQVGTIDNTSGVIELQPNQVVSDVTPTFTSIFTDNTGGNQALRRISFRTSATDLTTSSFLLRYATTNGTFLATSDSAGIITGTDIDSTTSSVDTTTGAVVINFTADVNPASLFYDAVAETTLPLDPELLGLDPVRLPPNGRVPVFDEGRHLVIFQEETTDIVGTPTAGQTVTLDRQDQAYIEVIDVNGQRLDYAQYTADRTAGTLTFADPLSLVDRAGEPLTAPYQVVDRVEDMALATSVEITGRVGISAPLTRDYPADTTRVASALVWGDIGSRVFNIFSQQSFDVWSDQQTTDNIAAQYDDVNFPIQINNADSFTGRWAAVFLNSNVVRIQEESLGVVLTSASIAEDIAPINPATGNPYFTIPAGGWGAGWITSNVLRFNTESGAENMWIIRTVQSGALTEDTDSIDIEIRGDAN